MRVSQNSWRKLTAPIAEATVLLLFLQFAVPSPCILSLPRNLLLALGGICHAAIDDDGHRPQQQPAGDACCHCLACQAGVAMALPPPAAGAVRPAIVAAAIVRSLPIEVLRGTVRQAYASRAPPMTG